MGRCFAWNSRAQLWKWSTLKIKGHFPIFSSYFMCPFPGCMHTSEHLVALGLTSELCKTLVVTHRIPRCANGLGCCAKPSQPVKLNTAVSVGILLSWGALATVRSFPLPGAAVSDAQMLKLQSAPQLPSQEHSSLVWNSALP